jgi:hypothetical protein
LCGGDKETFKEIIFENTGSFVPHEILKKKKILNPTGK